VHYVSHYTLVVLAAWSAATPLAVPPFDLHNVRRSLQHPFHVNAPLLTTISNGPRNDQL
jgi:hypothetical protein